MSESKQIKVALRSKVWVKYKGKLYRIGKCYCCDEEEITVDNFHCGHVISRKNGGENDLYNLRPICANCNLSMGTQNMLQFMRESGFDTKKLDNNEANAKLQESEHLARDILGVIDGSCCGSCNGEVKEQKIEQKENKIEDNRNDNNILCKYCNKQCSRRDNLKRHQKICDKKAITDVLFEYSNKIAKIVDKYKDNNNEFTKEILKLSQDMVKN